MKKRAILALAALLLVAAPTGAGTDARFATPPATLGGNLTLTTDQHGVSTELDPTTFLPQSLTSSPGIVVTSQATAGDIALRISDLTVSLPEQQAGLRNSLWKDMSRYGMTYSVYLTADLTPGSCAGVEHSPDAQRITPVYQSLDLSQGPQSLPLENSPGPLMAAQGVLNLAPGQGVKLCPVVSEPKNTSPEALLSFYLEQLLEALTTTVTVETALPGSAPLTPQPAPGMADVRWSASASASVTTALNLPAIQPQTGPAHHGFENRKYAATARYDVLKWRWPTSWAVDGRPRGSTLYGVQVLYRPTGTDKPFTPLSGSIDASAAFTRIVDQADGIYRPEQYVAWATEDWRRGAVGLHLANWADLGSPLPAPSGQYSYGLDLKFRFLIADARGTASGYYMDSPFYYQTQQTFRRAKPTLATDEVSQTYQVVEVPAESNLPDYYQGWGVSR